MTEPDKPKTKKRGRTTPRKRPPRENEGHPTKYRKEFCERLINHMAHGFSFESFAGLLQCSKQSLYSWSEDHEEFMDAKDVGTQRSRLFWESLGIEAAKGKIPNFNASVWIFNMKNRFGWRDREREELIGDIEPVVIDMKSQGRVISIEAKKK